MSAARHIVRWTTGPTRSVPLICFPWAGAGAAVFKDWPSRLPSTIDVWAARLPGRESRLNDPPVADIDVLAGQYADLIEGQFDRAPMLLGCCSGALLAFVLAGELERRRRLPPRRLFVAGHPAPSRPVPHQTFDDFHAALRTIGRTPAAVLGNAALLELMRPAFDADVRLAEGYRHAAQHRLGTPLTAFAGAGDAEMIAAWSDETTAEFELVEVEGGDLLGMSGQADLLPKLGDCLMRQDVSVTSFQHAPHVELTSEAARSKMPLPSGPVNAHNEWDPLEEVIIGTARGARIPVAGQDLVAIEFAEYTDSVDKIASGPLPSWLVDQTEVELTALCDALTSLGIVVRRPEPRAIDAEISTPDWRTDGLYDYCPRDVLLVVGDTIIETPMVLRSRFLEPFAYKNLLVDYFRNGARWLSAPKPRLADGMYDARAPRGSRLGQAEPAFDAANVLRFGTDILYLVSDTGNELGGQWLQSALGAEYTVHPCRNLYASTHVDSTIVPLRPGLVLLNPERVTADNLPPFLESWDKLYAPDLVETAWLGERAHCSKWIGMNLLVVNPTLVIADDRQPELIRMLERNKIDVLPLRLTHARTLGGSFHCVSLDIRRRGRLETYR